MKKFILPIIAGSIFILTGCGNVQPKPNFDQCKINGQEAPAWVCNGGANMEGGIYGVGSAPKSPLGISFQRNEAVAQARDEIARQLKVKVKNMIKSYLSATGTGDNQTAERVATQVSKQLTSQVLEGSKLLKTWQANDGTLYVLVGMNKSIKEQVKNATKTTFKNDQALWQEFKAKKAQEELDAAVDKEFK